MRVKEIQRKLDTANKIRAKLGSGPGVPVDRIIMKPGVTARDHNRALKEIERLESSVTDRIGAGVALHKKQKS